MMTRALYKPIRGQRVYRYIDLDDGQQYGLFCCRPPQPESALNGRDLRLMCFFAELADKQIERQYHSRHLRQEMRDRIHALLANDSLAAVYQPIYDTAADRVVGFEALSRFPCGAGRTPEDWFDEAAQVGLGVALEVAACRKLLAGRASLPPEVYLSLNVSPATITSGALARILEGQPLERLVLEITEHTFVREYLDLGSALRPLRARGLRIAVDDAGAGYASFRHILKLAPDVIKLDTSLVRGIDGDRAQRALAAAMIQFAAETGSSIVAEGVETRAELDALRALGATTIQGYLPGRPMALAEAAAWCRPRTEEAVL